MVHSIEWLRVIFLDFPILKYVLVFLGTALGGEFALITFAFLSAQGLISLYTLIPLSFLGTYSSDLLWFIVGRTKYFSSMIEHRYASGPVRVVTEMIKRISRGSNFLALVFAKFLFGTRIITIIYVSKTEFALKKFLHYNSYAVTLWVAVVIPIGYASGLGFTYLAHVFKNIYSALGFLLLALALITLLEIWIRRLYTPTKEEE